MIHHPFIRLLFGSKSSHSSRQTLSRKHKSLSVESLEDRHMLSISFGDGVVYDYESANSAVVAPQLGDNRGIFIADLTGDGKNEIIAAKDGYIQTFVNNSEASLPFDSAPMNFIPDSLGTYEGLAVGDFNSDSTPDAVSLVTRMNELSIYFWDGRNVKSNTTPTTDTVTTFDMFDILNITEVTSGNFSMQLIDVQTLNATGTGGNDLVCTISYQYRTSAELTLAEGRICVIFQGDGDGTFSDPIVVTGLPTTSTILGVGDLYGDSKMEVVVQTSNTTLDIYTVSASGSATKTGSYTHGSVITSVNVGDVDDDGKQDLLIYSKVSDQNHKLDIVKHSGSTSSSQIDSVQLSTNPSYIAVGDLDNDGKVDILVSNGSVYQVLLQQSNGEFTSQDQIITVADYLTSFTGDFDGDGIQDVLALGKRVATLIPGDTSIDPYVVLNFSQMDFTPRDFAVGDFDGNGTLDLAVLGGGQGSEILIFDGTPDGGDLFVKSKELTVTFGEQLLVGQFVTDHAGDDLAVICGSTDQGESVSRITVFKSTDLGLYAAMTSSPNVGYLSHLAVGSLISENNDDLVAINSKAAGDTVYVLKCDGNGTFTYVANVALQSGSVPTAIDIGDMDDDGKNDIVVLLAGQKSVQILKQNTNNQFAAQTAILVSNNIQSTSCTTMEVADFDGDGLLDIFVGVVAGVGVHAGSLFVLSNNSSSPGTFTLGGSIDIEEFDASNYGSLGISLGFLDNNASPDVVIVYNNRVVSFKNQLEFTLENGEVTLVFRDYNSAIVNSELSDLATLTNQKTFLDEWSCFQLEVWADTKSSNGVSEFSCTITFDPTIFEVEDLGSGNFVAEAGSAFTNFSCVVSGNQVTITGTLANSGDIQGDNTNTLLGRIAFVPAQDGAGLTLNVDQQYLKAYENGFSMASNSSIKTTNNSQSTPEYGFQNDTPLYPVAFDLFKDDTAAIDVSDYLVFCTILRNPDNQDLFYIADFNHDGSVDIVDWGFMATNFRQGVSKATCTENKTNAVYPGNFPEDWLSEAQPAALPGSESGVLTALALESFASVVQPLDQDQALISYLNALTATKRTETSFFDELASSQDDVDTLLKTGAL